MLDSNALGTTIYNKMMSMQIGPHPENVENTATVSDIATDEQKAVMLQTWIDISDNIINHIKTSAYVSLKDDMDSLKDAIANALVIAQDGGASFKQSLMNSSWYTNTSSSKIK